MSTAILGFMSVPTAASRVGLMNWQLTRLYHDKWLPQPPKIGPTRIIHEDDLPAIVAAARRAGYLPDDAGSEAGI